MNKFGNKLKNFTLLVLVLALTLLATPISTASAAGLNADDTPPTISADGIDRLSSVWERLQNAYERQGLRLDRAANFIDTRQSRLDQANNNGKDTAAAQAALDVFAQAIKNSNPIYNSAKGIIASHKGFDADGKVTDRIQALETVRSLGQSLKDIHNHVNDSFRLLRDELKAFREANRTE